jgi:ATP-dependent protease ClpP protease subunit
MRGIVAIAAAIVVIATECAPADFYVSLYSKTSWKQLPAHERVSFIIKENGARVVMDGEIKEGDFAQLMAIHALVPVHTLHVTSPGGSVSEAIKFIEFVDKYGIEVSTQCGRDPEECVCASACAFIWLAAPISSGHRIKVHRPYFRSGDFPFRGDADAMKEYEKAASQIRSLLLAKGYPQDFINNTNPQKG